MSVIAALLCAACGQERDDTAAAEAPEPVRPVEVVADDEAEDEEAENEELTRLRARVTELETQLTACQHPVTPTGAVPAGVDPPATPPATQTASADPARRDAGPRRRNDGTIRLDPTGILLGR